MKKIINYINEPNHNLIVDIMIIGEIKTRDDDTSSFNIKYKYIENGIESDYTLGGWAVEEDGTTSLYHSAEEYYYDNKTPFIRY